MRQAPCQCGDGAEPHKTISPLKSILVCILLAWFHVCVWCVNDLLIVMLQLAW